MLRHIVQAGAGRNQMTVVAAQHIPHYDMIPLAQPVRLRRLDPRIGRTEQVGMQDIVREIDVFEVTFETHAPTFLVTVGMVTDGVSGVV